MGDILWMQLKGKIGRVLKDCQNESFRELGPSQNFKFSFRLYCCVARTETKQLPQVLQIFDDRNAQNLIFWFSRFRSLWVLRFQKFLNRTKCHNSRTISPFNFKFGLRLDGLPPSGSKIKSVSWWRQGCYQKIFQKLSKRSKNVSLL